LYNFIVSWKNLKEDRKSIETKMKLSKSLYLKGRKCPRLLWLSFHHKELLERGESLTLKQGKEVGKLARELFKGGVEVEYSSLEEMLIQTQKLLKKRKTIYEATFFEKEVLVRVDILTYNEEGWELYEVKSSTSLKEEYLEDIALQALVVQEELELQALFLIYLNREYVREGELNLKELFVIEEVTSRVEQIRDEVKKNLEFFKEILSLEEPPEVEMDGVCFECEFFIFCWGELPKGSVFELYRMRMDKKLKLYFLGIEKIEEIPSNISLTKTQKVQVKCAKTNSPHIDKKILQKFLQKLEFPLLFLDFETFSQPIPQFNHQRPYQHLPFQYSLHILQDSLLHKEFLAPECEDPREPFIQALLKDLPPHGSVIVFNKSFESRILKELGEFEEAVLEIIPRIQDLLEPFRKLGYYHPDFKGSFSIKAIFPTLFPNELNYHDLEVQSGGEAMEVYLSLCEIEDSVLKEELKRELLEYCKLDTLAMVKIYQKLKEIVEG